MYRITRKVALAPTLNQFEIEAPLVSRKAAPGQFIILRIHDQGERIPLTIADFDKGKGTITCVFQEVGKTTSVVCVGGGVGVAPVHPIARALKQAGNEVVGIIGARTKELLFWEDKMRAACSELRVTTDDGSYVRKGFVTDVLREVIEEKKDLGLCVAIGPLPMMRAVSNLTREYGLKTIVSLNSIMVDGTGMCGCCRVTVDGKTRFACVDGPDLDRINHRCSCSGGGGK